MSARYEVEDVVGRGAMGVVYRARQVGAGRRVVAYKRVASADPVLLERLRREAAVLASLDHPNIVRIHELLDDEAGLAIVLQYAGGGSLADRLAARGTVGPADAATILIAMAEALDCAHRHGVLHRDVKPANILFTGDGHPLLSDFGVARRAGESPLTDVGALGPATAEYLDPVVANGAAYDARSDIYALGIVGYEMLAGRRPFTADHPLAVLSAADTAAAAPLRDVVAHMPVQLAAAIAAAMARDPADRPQSGAAFATALRAAVAALPSTIPPKATAPPASPVAAPPAPPADRADPPTRIFGPRPPHRSRTDIPAGVAWWRVGVAAAALLLIPSLLVAGRRAPAPAAQTPAAVPSSAAVGLPQTLPPAPAPALPVCTDVTVPAAADGWMVLTGDLRDTGCRSWVRHRGRTLQVQLPDGTKLRLRVGSRGDDVLLGDWDCNGTDTAALYAHATGVIYEFTTWPSPGRRLRSQKGRATGIVNGTASVDSSRGCDEVTVAPALGT